MAGIPKNLYICRAFRESNKEKLIIHLTKELDYEENEIYGYVSLFGPRVRRLQQLEQHS